MQLMFGIGALWGQRSDVSGIGPDQFAVLQENEITFDFEIKELYSQLGYPIDIARGKGKVTGKAKMARVFGALYADLFFGENAPVSGGFEVSEDEVVASLAAVTYTVANSATYVADLGLYYNTGGRKRFTYTTAAPTAGHYNVGAGVYTFASADIGSALAISYIYSQPTSAGVIFTINNNFMGFTPTFTGTFYTSRSTLGSSGQLTLRLNECVSSRLTFPSRIDDYNIPDFDWMAFSSGANVIGTISTTE